MMTESAMRKRTRFMREASAAGDRSTGSGADSSRVMEGSMMTAKGDILHLPVVVLRFGGEWPAGRRRHGDVMRVLVVVFLLWVEFMSAQQAPERAEAKGEPLQPGWCQNLPRPGYKKLERI